MDLIKGIAVCSGLESIDVQGATGTIRTNFEGKARAAVDAFKKGRQFVYIHLEAPDECAHQGSLSEKIESLQLIDRKIVKPVTDYLESSGGRFPPAGAAGSSDAGLPEDSLRGSRALRAL